MQVQNITVTAELGCHLHLDSLVKKLDNARLARGKFRSLIWHLDVPKCCLLLYENGKLVCVGIKTTQQAVKSIDYAADLLLKFGYRVRPRKFKMCNVVGSYFFNHPIDVEQFYNTHKGLCDYSPELFPALKYSINNQGLCALIFHNGKIIVTGSKTLIELHEAFAEVLNSVKECID